MTPLEKFVAPAKTQDGFWRVVVGTILIAVVVIIAGIVITLAAVYLSVAFNPSKPVEAELQTFEDGETAFSQIVFIFTLAAIWPGLWIVGRYLHRQPFGTFFSPARKFQPKPFLKGFLFGAVVYAALNAWEIEIAGERQGGLELDQWILHFIPLVVVIFLQASAEELLFRGYFLQQMARRWPHWLVWAVIPSIVFALLHFDDTLPGGGYHVLLAAFVAGLVFCALVWRSGSLWPAIGLHVVMNIFAFTVLGVDGVNSSTQLWIAGQDDFLRLMQADIATLCLMLVFVLSPMGRIFAPDDNAEEGPDQSISSVFR